ncbi:MAG: NAD(P)/FAD-dependent oxidoreductase [Thermoanaerobaculia bacterium]
MQSAEPLTVIGAGPAGLTAAILGRRAGRRVVVYERRKDVGGRFHGDFQGLENWSTERDVLDEIRSLGIAITFPTFPFKELVCFGPDGRERVFRSPSARPFYYLVRRGSGPDTLDSALKQQALAAGAEIRFGESLPRPPAGSVVAWGPRRADAIAVGYLFETDLPDSAFALLDDRLAPRGYAYLLVQGGRATLATCLWRDYHNEAAYLEKTLDFFQRKVGFTMRETRRFGSAVSTHLSPPAGSQHLVWAGEASGAQDALWGFGIRYALRSGQLAAAGPDPASTRRLWEQWIGGPLRASFVNRFFYERGGQAGYRALLWWLSHSQDPGRLLGRLYTPAWWQRVLFPLVYRSFAQQKTSAKAQCCCAWCTEQAQT